MKKMLLAGFFFLTLASFAQDGPKVVVFNSSESKEPEYWSKYNLVKFNVFEAFAGDFGLYYERILNKNFSAEIGLGTTLSNYASMIWNDNFVINDESVEPLMGFSMLLGGRYYPFRAADEFYVAPEFKFKYYHNNKLYTDLMGMDQQLEESTKIGMGRLTFGYVYFFDDNIFVDYSAGFGIGKITTNSLDYDTTTGEPYAHEKSTMAPRFHMGLKVGVAF
ncbi:MAG: DUF3575 domain-containing protein [Bacteroidetes bacterium]|nr:DUF3575 domain-containing protein [Bacteroidota bacterium]